MRPASVGGMATITRCPVKLKRSESTVTPDDDCVMRRAGALSTTRCPSWAATRSAIVCAPPTKRVSCAPPAESKLRSKVPGFCSFPEAAM